MNNIKLGIIPVNIVVALEKEYLQIKSRYSLSDWGPGELSGGRFAETILRIFQFLLNTPITPFGEDIINIEKTKIFNSVTNHPAIDEHIRQKVVPIVRLLLDFRNNRDVAHLGGFNANCTDTSFVMSSSTWLFCELIRVYGGYSIDDAQKIVDDLSIKDYPAVIEFEGESFVARNDLNSKQEVLVILNKHIKSNFDFLFSKTRDKNKSRFKKTIDEMVKDRLIGEKDNNYFLMPHGLKKIKDESLLIFN